MTSTVPLAQKAVQREKYLFRNADDPNEVVIVLEWNDLEEARRFAQSEDLREAMQRHGVVGQSDIYFLEEVERLPV